MRILEYPAVKQIDDSHWKLLENLEYKVHNNPDDLIIVPAGTITDFASVPRIFWSILPPFGRYSPAAIIHDELYRTNGNLPDGIKPPRTRKKCDDIFLEAMTVMGVGWMTRHSMYRAVRLFGWACGWKK